MQYLGIDWATRKAAWCSLEGSGTLAAEGLIPADEDRLARLVARLGSDVRAFVEMMSGAAWVRDRLSAAGWCVEIADARKVKAIAPLACKTDRVDARVLAELVRRDLVPALCDPVARRARPARAPALAHAPRAPSSWPSTASCSSGGTRSPCCSPSSTTSTSS